MLTGVVTRGRRNPLHYGLAKRLRAAREAADLGTAQLSLAAGPSDTTVTSIEVHGRVPLLDTVEQIARVLKISPCWLAYGVEALFIEGGDLQCSAVGSRLQQVRESRGMSKKTLATAAGVTRGMLLYIESGQSMPSVAMVEKIARALKIDPCWLAYGAGRAPDL